LILLYGNDTAGYQAGRIYYDPLFGKPTELQRYNGLVSDLSSLQSSNWVTQKLFTLNSEGLKVTETDGAGHQSTYTYDALNRKTLITDPSGATTKFVYDDLTVTTTDGNGNVKKQTYDVLDRLATVIEYPSSSVPYTTSYAYDSYYDNSGDKPVYHLITMTNPKGAVTTNTFDNLGRLTRTDFPQDGSNPLTAETFTYDDVGNLLTKTNAKGTRTLTYEYYAGYRVKQVAEADGRIVAYTYDANDNPLTQSWNGNSYTYTYDVRNRVNGITANLDGYSFGLGYDYDVYGRVIGITYPGRSSTVQYEYDVLDRLRDIPGFVTSCSYDEDNKLTEMIFGNGIANDYVYDQNDRPINIAVGSSEALLNLNYSYDKVGNVTQINNDYYSYDGLNRLTWAGDQATAATGNGTSWTYDAAGNMSSKENYVSSVSQGNIAFSYDLANRLWSMGSKTYTNDAAGARTAKVDTDAWVYIYDGESRLTEVTKNGAAILDNTYDGSGMRVKQASNDKMTYYIYQGNNPIAEYSVADGKYTYLIYAGNKLVAEEKDGVVKYYHKDHLGSTRVVTDAAGNVVATYKFKPYGEVESHTGEDIKYGFTGKEEDSGSGLKYFGARFYDAETGRFITPDTYTNLPDDERFLFESVSDDKEEEIFSAGLSNPQMQNRYSYCQNNPIVKTDPDGHFVPLVIAGVYIAPYVVTGVTIAAGVVTGYLGGLLYNEIKHTTVKSETGAYQAGHRTPGGRELSDHAARRANAREFTDKIIDNIINANKSSRQKQIDDDGSAKWKYTDKQGNVVVTNEKGDRIITVVGAGDNLEYSPPDDESSDKPSTDDEEE
jgi:RHS repeat-associated protein